VIDECPKRDSVYVQVNIQYLGMLVFSPDILYASYLYLLV